MAKFIKTEYGRKKMIFEGYVYVRNAFSQDKQTKYWICELNERKGRENSCMGRAVTSMRHESEDFDVTVTQNHSHAPGIELQRSPSTESIKSDRTEPGNVPDTSAFADEIFDKEQQNDKIINEIMEKLNNETNMDQTINEEKMENITMGTTLNYTINKIQQLNNSLPLQQTETTLPTTSIEQEPPPVLEPETNNSVQVSDAIADAFSFASNIISNKTTKPSNFSLKVLDKRLLPSTPNGFLLWSADYKRQNHKGNLDFSGHSEMQKILGRKWHALPVEERRIWMEKANQMRMVNSRLKGIPILVPRPPKKKIKKNKTQNILKESLSQPNQIGNNTLITENNLQESSSQQMINEENEQHQNNNPLETPDKYLLKKVPNKQNSSTSDNNYKNEVKNLNCFVAQMLLSQYRDGKLTTSEQLLNELTNAGIFISLWNLNIYLIKMKLAKKQYLVPLYSSPNEGQFFLIGSDQEWRKFKATNYLSKHFLHELDCLKCLKLRRKERSNTWGQLGKAVLRFGELDDNIPILHHQNCTGESLEYLHKLHYSPNIAPEIISPQLEENARERVSNFLENATPLEILEESVRMVTSSKEHHQQPSPQHQQSSSSQTSSDIFPQQSYFLSDLNNQSSCPQQTISENSNNYLASSVLQQLLEKSKQPTNKEIILIDDDEQITNNSTITTVTTTSNTNELNNNKTNNEELSKLIIGLSEIAKELSLSFIRQRNSNNLIILPQNITESKRSLSIIPMPDNILIVNAFIGSILQETLRWSSLPDGINQLLYALRGKCYQFFYKCPALIPRNNCQGNCGWILRNDHFL
ncbi:hypothetical protein ACQ4LE_009747 [Meloidogyne hapla]